MANACETIEKLAREAETRRILEILEDCRTLDEAKQRVRELITK